MYKSYLALLCCVLCMLPFSKIAAQCTPTIVITSSPGDTVCAGTTVTFSSTITNGGTAPAYQWQLNGVAISGATGSSYSNTFNNFDEVNCVLTSNASCASITSVTSNNEYMSINPALPPTVGISANPGNVICTGTSLTLYVSAINNQGTSPQFQWYKNSTIITGATTSSYTPSTVSNGDIFYCTLTNTASCSGPSTVNSNNITVTINSSITPTISITVTPDSVVCPGTTIAFTSAITNGGSTPHYQWKKNGSAITGATTGIYSPVSFSTGDIFSCVLTSSSTCAVPSTATSNGIGMTISTVLVPAVNISANPGTSITGGTNITFTASATNGGASPSYQWTLNGNNISGATNSTYSSSTLSNGDVIDVIMHSAITCAAPDSAISNRDTITITNLGLQKINGVSNDIVVYPNPSTGTFSINTSQKGVLHFYSMLGQEIYQYNILENNTIVNLPSAIPQGIYIGKFITDNGKVSGVLRLVYQR